MLHAVGVCDPPPHVKHATRNMELATIGSVVTYTCDPGFAFSDGHTLAYAVCDGLQWLPTVNECQGELPRFYSSITH